MKNLFAYGTLMCEDIMGDVSGCRLPSPSPGTLKGYSRWCVKGEPYPALVRDEKKLVEGMVYRNVPDSAWDRLDAFEGEMYERRLVRIESGRRNDFACYDLRGATGVPGSSGKV